MIAENFIKIFEKSFRKNWKLNALTDYSEKRSYTYEQLATEIARLHILFKELHINQRDKISLVGKNNTQWCIAYMAVVTYGAVIVPILQDFNANDIHHIVNHSDSVLLFSDDTIWDSLDDTKMPQVKGVFSLNSFFCFGGQSRSSIERILEKQEDYFDIYYPNGFSSDDISYADIPNSEVLLINYTSGTTGFSKGVMLTGNNLAGNVTFGTNSKLHFQGSRCVSFLPLAHAYGCSFDFLTPLAAGGHVTLLAKIPSPKILLKAFAEVRPHLILCVPLILEKIYRKQIIPEISKPLINLLLKVPGVRSLIYAKIRRSMVKAFGGKFHQVVVGGAPLSQDVKAFLIKIKFPFTIGYGMTECGPLISYSPWQEFIAHSSGKVLPGIMNVKIDSIDPLNVPGEILVKGENVMKGYYKNDEATSTVIDQDGWLHTGDMGTVNEYDCIFIRGRCKSMLLGASGQNIYPEEIEAKLNGLPCVMESLIIERNKKLVALVYPDYETLDSLGIDADIKVIMDQNKSVLNAMVAPYEKISEIELYPTEFEKTPKRSIKRYLYTSIASKL